MASFVLRAHLELIPFKGLATLCTAVFTQTNPYHTHVLLHTEACVDVCRYTRKCAVTPTHKLTWKHTLTGAISLCNQDTNAPLLDKTNKVNGYLAGSFFCKKKKTLDHLLS